MENDSTDLNSSLFEEVSNFDTIQETINISSIMNHSITETIGSKHHHIKFHSFIH